MVLGKYTDWHGDVFVYTDHGVWISEVTLKVRYDLAWYFVNETIDLCTCVYPEHGVWCSEVSFSVSRFVF
jgi:hypothetical protein